MSEQQQQFRQFSFNRYRPPASFAGRLLGFIGAVIAAILAFMFSLAALAVVAVGATLLGGWLWWKTRAVRKQIQEQMDQQTQQRPLDGFVIEGEAVRETGVPAVLRRLPE
jgi:Flp pilus assembly protein TadB